MGSPNARAAAFFDVDRTCASSNLLNAYLHFALDDKRPLGKAISVVGLLTRVPIYAYLDWRDRVRFIRRFFRNYNGVPLESLELWARGPGLDYWCRRLYQEARDQVNSHREQGHKVVLLTGGLLEMVTPLSEILHADEVMASRCRISEGRFTGELESGPLGGSAKALAAEAWARESGIDLSESYAYADDTSDLPLLDLVGHPIAVNPERRLQKLAHSRGWPVRRWTARGLPS